MAVIKTIIKGSHFIILTAIMMKQIIWLIILAQYACYFMAFNQHFNDYVELDEGFKFRLLNG